MIGRREKNPSSCVIAGTGQFVVVWVMSPGFHCCFLQLLCCSGKKLHCSWWEIWSAETLDPMHKRVCLCMCASTCDGNVNANRKWPVSHTLTSALSPSCWSVCTQKQPHTDVRTDTHTHTHTHTAGLPVSGDLGWASEALHGFSHPLIPTVFSIWTGDQLILLLYPFSPFLSSFTSHIPTSHFHHRHKVTKVLNLNLVVFPPSTCHSHFGFRHFRLQEANINEWDLSKRSGSEHSLGALLCSAA